MQAVAEVFGDRDVPVAVEKAVHGTSSLPVIDGPEKKKTPDGVATLTVWACPYPELAEVDRGICAMERMMFAELLEQNVRLTACRLDGDACCQFQTGPLPVSNAVASS
jgi:predicted ArsR family transcriptional regulator